MIYDYKMGLWELTWQAEGMGEVCAPLAGSVVSKFELVKMLLMGKNKSNQYN